MSSMVVFKRCASALPLSTAGNPHVARDACETADCSSGMRRASAARRSAAGRAIFAAFCVAALAGCASVGPEPVALDQNPGLGSAPAAGP
jgi:hypothetical protein